MKRNEPSQLKTERHQFFSSCPTGLEAVLSNELKTLGVKEARATRGGVSYGGPLELCYRINLESRIASRVLWRVFHGPYRSEQDVREATYSLPWANWFGSHHTMKVKVSARRCPLKSLDFVTLTIKDAICDKFRALTRRRPTVDTHKPDIRIEAFLDATHFTLYVDTSGEALFKRGYRRGAVAAPLRENLAAGIIRLSDWRPDQILLDPMCGGGTILIEAAHMAQKVAPGLGRAFAFEHLSWFDPTVWRTLRETSRAEQRQDLGLRIYGSDSHGSALNHARENLSAAGLVDLVRLSKMDFVQLTPPASEGILITNPPYGVRMGDLGEFYVQMGSVLKQQFAGWRVYILTADLGLPGQIRLAESRRIPLFNGALECRLFEFKMVKGTMRRTRKRI